MPVTTDPVDYAEAVAHAVFDWDTTIALMPRDYAAVVVAAGDPSGLEINGLASDVRTYLPTDPSWVELRKYQTRQHLVIDKIVVPEAWDDALTQAAPGQILPGTTAYTIDGTRHRDGIWNNDPVTSSHEVAFTVFVTCAPTFDPCRVLRLSQLDNPLR